MLGRKQQSQVARSFPNRYLFSYANKVTSLFSISCILDVILDGDSAAFVTPKLSAIMDQAHEQGSKSCELLLRHLAGDKHIYKEIVPMILKIRESSEK